MEIPSTNEKIMTSAIILFSDRGYDTVSMRDIAAVVGINVASIYHHFLSKLDILKSIYEYYTEQVRLVAPNLKDLLRLMETEPLEEVLVKTNYYYDPQIQDKMDRIILIASQRISQDRESENFIQNHFFKPKIEIWAALLSRGIELGSIKPIETESFMKLITYYAFSAAELSCTTMKLTKEQWENSMKMLYSLLKPVSVHEANGDTNYERREYEK